MTKHIFMLKMMKNGTVRGYIDQVVFLSESAQPASERAEDCKRVRAMILCVSQNSENAEK